MEVAFRMARVGPSKIAMKPSPMASVSHPDRPPGFQVRPTHSSAEVMRTSNTAVDRRGSSMNGGSPNLK